MHLKRGLSLFSGANIVMGSVIGSGIFFVVSEITRALPDPWVALSVWITSGVVAILGGLCYSELGAMYPGAGGSYLYFKESFHPIVGFLFGWALSTVIQTGSIAAVAVSFGQVMSQMFSLDDIQIKIAAALAIAILSTANFFGVRRGADIVDSLTSIKALILVVIGVGGAYYFFNENVALAPTTTTQLSYANYGVALIAAFWAYDGWVNVTYAAGEVQNPTKTIPRSMLLGIGICMFLYLLVNFGYYQTLSIEEIKSSSFPAGDAVGKIFGAWAQKGLQWAMVISTLGCVSAMILTGARISYAMGVDGLFPKKFAELDHKYATPRFAIFIQMLISIILVLWGTYEQLFTFLIASGLLFYALAPIALIVLRKTQPERTRPFHVPFYPIVPLLYLICTVTLLINTIFEKPYEAGVGFIVVATGVPVYFLTKRGMK